MDTGEGRFKTIKGLSDLIEKQKLYPGHGGLFKEGEIIVLKGSRFKVSKIIQSGLKLKLLPKYEDENKNL